MNKFFTTLLLFVSSSNLQAQDGYIKYHTDSEYRGKAVKVYKGEILPYFNSTKASKINVLIGNDTITDLALQSKNYEIVQSPNTSYQSQKGTLVQLKKGGLVLVNATVIPRTDTVTLIAENGKQLTQLIDKREAQINQPDCGKIFRLIITNAPSIFYASDKLTPFVEPEQPEQVGTKTTEEVPKAGWAWWYYALIILVAGGIGFGFWKIIKGRKKIKPNEAVFNSSSLKDFASQYGGVKKLGELNPNLIPPNWDKLQNTEKQQIINNLQGKRLIVRGDNETSFGFQETNKDSSFEQPITRDWDSPKETFVQPSNFSSNDNISQQLRQVENSILSAIRLSGSGNNNSNELNKLRNEKTELESKLKTVENEKKNSELKQMQLQTDKSTLENNLQNANDEKNKIQNEIKELKEKVIAVEFLKGYSETVFSYLKYCQQVSNEVINFFNKIYQQNPNQAITAGHFLMKFQNSVNSILIGDWLRTVQDIKDSGATTNRQLTRSFVLIQNDNDKLKEFQRLLFSDVLTQYSSNLLILVEAFKNLSRFQGSTEFANEAQNTFGKHVTEIVNKAKSTGLELKYVSLFESWEKHIGQVEDYGGERSLAYKEITGLEKGAIAEIVSFGVKTPLGEDTKTIIILA